MNDPARRSGRMVAPRESIRISDNNDGDGVNQFHRRMKHSISSCKRRSLVVEQWLNTGEMVVAMVCRVSCVNDGRVVCG